ncbi:hypothetical protein BDV29DRAFT_179634 [Aspergillus leporis]|uniref:Uncharacterized protein n=1 Tax=Aspergillus leporis TaxID=41062 RepID=A0A5N5WVD2_9EURO|nr:hypothetical protein BDV29DRAFT_179634 [Aspergillus leporis]
MSPPGADPLTVKPMSSRLKARTVGYKEPTCHIHGSISLLARVHTFKFSFLLLFFVYRCSYMICWR